MEIAVGEKMMVKQTSLTPENPWGYRIIEVESSTTVKTAGGLTSSLEIFELDEETFGDYDGKTLLLEIFDAGLTVVERDTFVLTGLYRKYPNMQFLLGLLGENTVQSSALTTDYSDGHQKHKTVTLYDSAALDTELAQYDWAQAFVTDFRPDARYQRSSIRQRRES